MRYYNYPPNGMIYGASLKIQNTSSEDVTGLYGDSGIFLTFGGEGGDGSPEQEFPLVTAAENGIVTIPAYSTVWINRSLPAPIKPQQQCRIAVDSTSIPQSCILTAVVHIGMWQNEVKGTVV